MTRRCQNCSRLNPRDARFCFFDGVPLSADVSQASNVPVEERRFTSPLVMPSGRQCHSFNDLVLACEERWDEATSLLQNGMLGGFLRRIGRSDLAQFADVAARSMNLDRGLEDFLSQIPCTVRKPARLVAEPSILNVGQIERGPDLQVMLRIRNSGMGLLHGSMSCDVNWLSFGQGTTRRLIQCRDSLDVPVQISPSLMRASRKVHEGVLVVETNGGSLSIPVQALLPIKPFRQGVLAGASTPREIAEKARDKPKESADWFESGAVASWFRENGWTYPIQGPPASGVGGIQQFFEALGLAKAPQAEISTMSVRLEADPNQVLEFTLVVSTKEKRPVYAHAASMASWIQVGDIQGKGRRVKIKLHVQAPPHPEEIQGKVVVTANGGQRFPVTVSIRALPPSRGPSVPTQQAPMVQMDEILAPPPEAIPTESEAVPVPMSDVEPVAPRSRAKHFLLLWILLLASLGIVVHDVLQE